MSRVLKIIVNVVLVCALLSAAALLVPSLAGIEMNIIENDRVETNLSVGSVVYGKMKDLKDIKFGDDVFIKDSDGSEYLYRVNAVDAENGTVVLKDAKNDAADTVEKEATSLCVAIVTVPLLGYLAVAAGTVKGWVIIGLCALLLLLLFALSEIWRKDKLKEEEEDDEDGDADELEMEREEKKRKKKEKKARKKAEKYEDDEDDEYEAYLKKKQEKKAARKARKEARKEAKQLSAEPMARTRAIEAEPEPAETEEPVQNTADLFEAARMEIASSVSSAMAEDQPAAAQPEASEVDFEKALTQELAKAATDAVNEKAAEAETKATEETESEESQEIVIPCYTADELIRKAIMAGDEPDIIEDRDLGLTLLDYTDCL